jgi:hypothetical protein
MLLQVFFCGLPFVFTNRTYKGYKRKNRLKDRKRIHGRIGRKDFMLIGYTRHRNLLGISIFWRIKQTNGRISLVDLLGEV